MQLEQVEDAPEKSSILGEFRNLFSYFGMLDYSAIKKANFAQIKESTSYIRDLKELDRKYS